MFNLSHKQLKEAERSVYSQAGQDGVLEAIFDQIDSRKLFVEFGARDGLELSNTANLRLNHGWKGLLMDAYPLSDIVEKENVTKDNIMYLLYKYKVEDCGLLCIDVDGNDYWIWEAIKDMPHVVVIEYNSKFRNDESYAIEYNPNHIWEGDDYYGASLLALKKLGEKKGYTLVHIVGELDAFFVRNDLLDKGYVAPTIEELLPEPIIAHEKISNKKWVKI
jgi:hypothetical protein